MANIFTYGSLMYPIVWQTVVRGQYRKYNAELRGYECRAVKSEEYPMVVPALHTDSVVSGVVYEGVSQEDIYRLDAFEGELYNRQREFVYAEVGRGHWKRVVVNVYVASGAGRLKVARSSWSREQFEKVGLKKFRARYAGFSLLET